MNIQLSEQKALCQSNYDSKIETENNHSNCQEIHSSHEEANPTIQIKEWKSEREIFNSGHHIIFDLLQKIGVLDSEGNFVASLGPVEASSLIPLQLGIKSSLLHRLLWTGKRLSSSGSESWMIGEILKNIQKLINENRKNESDPLSSTFPSDGDIELSDEAAMPIVVREGYFTDLIKYGIYQTNDEEPAGKLLHQNVSD